MTLSRLIYKGKLPPIYKILMTSNNVMAWVNGSARDKTAMRNRIQQGYEGVFTNDVSKYDELAFDHYFDLAKNLIDGIDCKDKTILDVGCGTGTLTQRVLEKGAAKVVCVDFSQYMIDQCKEKFDQMGYASERIEFKQADAENLPFENNSFDLVVSGMMFGMVVDQEKYLSELHRVTKPGGNIAISTHGPEWYCEIVETFLKCMMRHYPRKMTGTSGGVECHNLTEDLFQQMLKKQGFTDILTKSDKGRLTFKTGGDVWDFFAACSSAWFLELFNAQEREDAVCTIRDYFLKKNITKVTYDAVMGYGRKS